MIKNLSIVILIAFCCTINAQKVKFGKVNEEELKEVIYDKDSSAVAAYLYKYRYSYYQYQQGSGVKLITEIHERIKIYKKGGFDFATESVNLFKSGNANESMNGIKGYTYNLVDGEVVKSKLDKKSIFKSEYSKNYNQVKFTMPDAKVGSVLEYQYKITSPYIQSVDEYVFQENIPVRKLEAYLKILDYFKYNQRAKGFLYYRPNVTKERINTLDINADKIAYNISDIPALKKEKYVTNMNNYRAGVKYEIVSFEVPGVTHENFSKSWEDVAKTIYKSSRFGTELKKKKYYSEDLAGAIAGVGSEEEKVDRILTLVKKKVKWNSYRGVYCDEGVKEAYKKGIGNSGDINLMLVSMLNEAGITAYPILVSTRDHGVPLFPTLEGFNYVVAGAKVNGKEVLLDATNPFSTPDVIPLRAMNWFGRKIAKDGRSEMFELQPSKKAVDMAMVEVTLSDDNSMEAKVNQRYTGHYALNYRSQFHRDTKDDFIKEMEEDNGDIEISNFEIKEALNLKKPLSHSYEAYAEDVFEVIDGKMYLSPMFYFGVEENPFKSEKREYPIDFGYQWNDRYGITINIPEGYQVESMPEPVKMALPNKLGSFTFNLVQQQNQIKVQSNLAMNSPMIGPDMYSAIKEFYSQVVKKHSEKIVLSKI